MPTLWRDLQRNEQHQFASRFIHLSPPLIETLSEDDFYLFAQWVYGKTHGRMAASVTKQDGNADFVFELPDNKREFLRVYAADRIPVAMLHNVLETVNGESYQKIRVYMRAAKNEASRRLQQEFPLAFEMVDIEGLKSRLADLQRTKKRWLTQPTTRSRQLPVRNRKRRVQDVVIFAVVLIALSFLLVLLVMNGIQWLARG